MVPPAVTKTVAVLGASYGGACAAQHLAQGLPKGWRVVVIDRNSHMNHLYALPRYAVASGHEHKAFIPYGPMFHRPDVHTDASTVFLHAQVTSLTPRSLTLSRAFPEHGLQDRLEFDYAVYALGSHLPAPIDLWRPVDDADTQISSLEQSSTRATATGGTKAEGIAWLKRFHSRIEAASNILIVGGGPLGVQYASDIKDVFPDKGVTLLHSRTKLLPAFSQQMHDEIMKSLDNLKVSTILGDRLDLRSAQAKVTAADSDGKEERVVRTLSGREIRADLVLLCTGQKPNTALLAQTIPDAIVGEGPTAGLIRVVRTMQVAVPAVASSSSAISGSGGTMSDSQGLHVPYPHLFAVGDAADAFGANKAGRSSFRQASIAAENIIRLVHHSQKNGSAGDAPPELQHYEPDPLSIKISLGLNRYLIENNGEVRSAPGGPVDMNAYGMWQLYGVKPDENDASSKI